MPERITGRMTLEDIAKDLRARNCPIDKGSLSRLICDGVFPFGHVLSTSGTGRKNILVLSADYYPWADERIGPYIEEVTANA